jgi:hypothetical protein
VADCLSHYYKSDTLEDQHLESSYVKADIWLDPDEDDLTAGRKEKLRAQRVRKPKGASLPRDEEAQALDEAAPEETGAEIEKDDEEDPSIEESVIPEDAPVLQPLVEGSERFLEDVHAGYTQDVLYSKILSDPGAYSAFSQREGLLYSKNSLGNEVLCIPRVVPSE